MRSTGKVAIVTGGSRGIGRAVAVRLAEDGFAVVVGYAGHQAAANEVVEAIHASGGRALAMAAEVADEQAVADLFRVTTEAFGGIDAVVNSAGEMRLARIAELDLSQLDQLYRTNIRGTFVVNQQAARHVRAGGAVVNLSSSVVGLAFPTYGAYAASKSAVEALSLVLARELRGRDVTVNAVAPGPTATDLFFEGKDDATIQRLASQAPLERLGTPGDIAAVIAFLVGSDGHWVNGQVIRANGGIV